MEISEVVLNDLMGNDQSLKIPVNLEIINVAQEVQKETTIELFNTTVGKLGRAFEAIT